MSYLFHWSHLEGSRVYVSSDILETLEDIAQETLEGFPPDYEMSPDGNMIAVMIFPPRVSRETLEETERRYTQALSLLDHKPSPFPPFPLSD